MAQQINVEGREFRAVTIADRWAKSEFEYFYEPRSEWRRVVNWNRRASLFTAFTGAEAA